MCFLSFLVDRCGTLPTRTDLSGTRQRINTRRYFHRLPRSMYVSADGNRTHYTTLCEAVTTRPATISSCGYSDNFTYGMSLTKHHETVIAKLQSSVWSISFPKPSESSFQDRRESKQFSLKHAFLQNLSSILHTFAVTYSNGGY